MSKLGRILGVRSWSGHRAGNGGDAAPPKRYGHEDFLFKNGEFMVILRPADPARKLAWLDKIPVGTPHEIAQPLFQEALDEQPHRFIGYASRRGAILNSDGEEIEAAFQPGDSFSGGPHFQPPAFMLTGKIHEEIWDGDTVVVLPRPDLRCDSCTGVVTKSRYEDRRGAIVLRAGGPPEVDCHLPTLNRIITGDPNIDYRTQTKGDASAPSDGKV